MLAARQGISDRSARRARITPKKRFSRLVRYSCMRVIFHNVSEQRNPAFRSDSSDDPTAKRTELNVSL